VQVALDAIRNAGIQNVAFLADEKKLPQTP
jgi:hypothetical protein